MKNKTLDDLQRLKWRQKQSKAHADNPQRFKVFTNTTLRIGKCVGVLQELAVDLDRDEEWAWLGLSEAAAVALADLVILAARAAENFPGGMISLQNAVNERVKEKMHQEKAFEGSGIKVEV